MEVCATIAEYNPFHLGHLYHSTELLRRLGRDCGRVAIMSGNYVQRGDCALLEKYRRAQVCVQAGGADLVVELPLSASLSSAQRFAEGGVRLAQALGCVTHLAFGCETPDERALRAVAHCLNTPEHAALLRERLAQGLSYAAAAQGAVEQLCPKEAGLLSQPNNTLAISYCGAVERLSAPIQPVPIQRLGAAHDSNAVSSTASASHIRQLVRSGADVSAYVPEETQGALTSDRLHALADMQAALLPYLRRLTPEQLRAFPNVSEGLEHRFIAAAQKAATLEELFEGVRSRRFPLSRVRRLALCAYLGITEELAALPPQYVLVLAMNDIGRRILHRMKTTCTLPVITRPTQARALTGDAARLWALTGLADDLYAFPEPGGQGWRRTPYAEKRPQ